MPLTPFFRFDQNVSRVLPTGVTTPIPVMTTLRSDMTMALSLKVGASAASHSDVLHSLEEFSFSPDRRRDDDFSLLELRKIACAYVAHASGDCADEILAPVINFGRAEQDLFQ